jgi:hypothetical protein
MLYGNNVNRIPFIRLKTSEEKEDLEDDGHEYKVITPKALNHSELNVHMKDGNVIKDLSLSTSTDLFKWSKEALGLFV